MGFIKEVVTNFTTIGSVYPSSSYLVEAMVQTIPQTTGLHIVEFGAGTGVITRELIKKCGSTGQVWSLEMQTSLVTDLYYLQNNNVHIIHANALDFERYIGDNRIDYIVSSLPLALMDNDIKQGIIAGCARVLNNHGSYIQFQYSLNAKKLLESHFTTVNINTIVRNIPPAFVYRCCNR